MPQPRLPPTPGSSADIKGQDGTHNLTAFQLTFELPEPAIHDASPPTAKDPFSPVTADASRSSVYPLQVAETVKARRRSAAAKDVKENTFALPPPPTRSRKIIQMKPQQQREDEDKGPSPKDMDKASVKTAAADKKTAHASAGAQGKKKQPSATSVAGRKVARKTAHSLIERRRRGKMNEEFAVLKNMIPACTGEMHKLSILQASIEYIRYLENCIAKLKEQQDEQTPGTPSAQDRLPSIREFHPTFCDDGIADVEMTDSEAPSPTFTAQPSGFSLSPVLRAEDSRHRQQSCSSVSTDYRYYSLSICAGTSPAFDPQLQMGSEVMPSMSTSPALRPQSGPDQEAMAALMMLNMDRRDVGSRVANRGMSVRDLLSS